MYRLRHFAPFDTLKSVYYALFYPFLTYGITVWGATHKNFLHPVSVCQKKAVRAMTFNDPLAHTSPIFSELQLLKLEDIHCLHISSFVYECHNKLAPIHFRDYFTQMSKSIHIILEVPLAVTFFSSEKIPFNMVYAPYASMELKYGLPSLLKYGLPSLLISETLHQSETSRINSKNAFYNLTVTKHKIQILSRSLVIY